MAMKIDGLPAWVYDVVIALQKWQNEHPPLFMERYDRQYLRLDDACGCQPLEFVPPEVLQNARVLAHYLAQRPDPAAAAEELAPWERELFERNRRLQRAMDARADLDAEHAEDAARADAADREQT